MVGRNKLGLRGELGLGRAGGTHVAVAAGELLNATRRVDELLFTGEVGVAGCADTDLDVVLGGAGLVGGSAGTDDGGIVIIGMEAGFHKNLVR